MSRVYHTPHANGYHIQYYLDVANETGMPVLLTSQGLRRDPFTITVLPVGGDVTVEYSTSPPLDVLAGTGVWTPWGSGTVSTKTSDVLLANVTALRMVGSSGGTGTMEIAA